MSIKVGRVINEKKPAPKKIRYERPRRGPLTKPQITKLGAK